MTSASIVARLIAWLIDGFVLGFVAMAIQIIFTGIIGTTGGGDNLVLNLLAGTALLMMIVVLFVLQFAYFGYFWSTSGQTPGMKVMHIKVVERQSGALVSRIIGALRGTVGYYISSFLALGYLWAIFDEHNEAWHDKLFSTRVVTA
ncbi:MAG: RDD family protein [Caldilineaceae bacterium]|nr:RDD family protein [Caldilineaceae bacterium]MCB0127294.1 RDD family protein [Caldilineaceae bacterium]